MIIETLLDKRKFAFNPHRDGWLPHLYEENKQIETFYGFKPDWTVVEAGAWIGTWLIWAAPQVEKVYALEPVPELMELLRQNIELNGFKNIRLFESALFGKTGKAEMDVTVKPAASTLVDAWSHGAEWLYEGGRKITIQTYTWDDWVKENNIEEVNLFKLDVEGAELSILMGLDTVLPERIAIAIYHIPSPLHLIFQMLHEKGYILDGFGYYDYHARNQGKPHTGFFRRKDIPFQTPESYKIGPYERPTEKQMAAGIPFYWGETK